MQKLSSNLPSKSERLAVRIRRGLAKDVAAMRELAGSSLGASHWSTEIYERVFAADALPRRAWVAELPGEAGQAGGGLLGFLVALTVGAEWELENLAVLQKQRRRGLGRRLLRALVVQARKVGADSIFLEVRESNQAARRFYESGGFQAEGRRPGYYSDPAEAAIVYRREVRRQSAAES